MKSLLRSSILALIVVGAIAGVTAKNARVGAVTTPGRPPCNFCSISGLATSFRFLVQALRVKVPMY